MKGFREGFVSGLGVNKPKRPLSKKEKEKLKRLLERQRRAKEALY